MQTEEIIRNHRTLHRLTIALGSLAALLLLLAIADKAYELFVVFNLTDCQFGWRTTSTPAICRSSTANRASQSTGSVLPWRMASSSVRCKAPTPTLNWPM